MVRMHALSGAVLALAPIVVLAAPAGADTYYVNGTCGDNAWTGTSPVCAPPNGPKVSIAAGLTIAQTGDEVVVADGTYFVSGFTITRGITLRSSFGADTCIIDGSGSRIFLIDEVNQGTPLRLQGLTLRNGAASEGGAMRAIESDLELIDCIVRDNEAEVGAGLNQHSGTLVLSGCTFASNSASAGAAGLLAGVGSFRASNCRFDDNVAFTVGAVGVTAMTVEIANCTFARNEGGFLGGGGASASPSAMLVNCAFSRNEAEHGGGWAPSGRSTFVNCTFSQNAGQALYYNHKGPVHVRNSISWGNTVTGLVADTVTYSDVEGGSTGEGNIDADPQFASPASDDVHLTIGSPCVDAGRNEDLPVDVLDLDGDGDVDEPVPYDLDGNPRIDGKLVDMGAYEGAGETQDATATEPDLDQGEIVALVPEAVPFDPVSASAGVVINLDGPDNQSFSITQILWDLHPQARGFTEIGEILRAETTLADGQFMLLAFITFDAQTLGGIDPTTLDITAYDPSLGDWVLAASLNTQDSPGHDGPVGDRHILVGEQWSVSNDLGDHGVFWSPTLEQGFVWARLDHAGDLAFGLPTCLGDCGPVDGQVSAADLLALLSQWGGPGTCDLNGDGVIGSFDLAALLADTWGLCAQPSLAPPRRPRRPNPPARIDVASADVTGDGRVDRADMDAITAAWGACPEGDCPAHVDHDGRVGTSDLLAVLTRWGE